MSLIQKISILLFFIIAIFILTSHKPVVNEEKVNEKKLNNNQKIEHTDYETSAAIGYCASLANMAFNTEILPDNVVFYEDKPGRYFSSGIIYVKISKEHPLPYSEKLGEIMISAVWDNNEKSGVMDILFKNIHILNQKENSTLIKTIPFVEDFKTGKIITVFDHTDIINNKKRKKIHKLRIVQSAFDYELARTSKVNSGITPINTYFVKIDQQNTYPDMFDDDFEITPVKQIATVPNNK